MDKMKFETDARRERRGGRRLCSASDTGDFIGFGPKKSQSNSKSV